MHDLSQSKDTAVVERPQHGESTCLVSTGSATRDRQFKSSLRNQRFVSFNHFRKPGNHPNLYRRDTREGRV
jgi:hypothetical protein